MTKKSTRKTPQQTTHSLEKNSRHKKLDTLSSSQTTHSQEKPTNQQGSQAFLKAPENLTTKISNLSTRLAMNQATTVQKPCLGKIPIATKPEPALNHQPLAAAGTILTPHTPNPSTQNHVHHNTFSFGRSHMVQSARSMGPSFVTDLRKSSAKDQLIKRGRPYKGRPINLLAAGIRQRT